MAEHATEEERGFARYFMDHALSWPNLRNDCPPCDWLAWADRMGFPVPVALREAVPPRADAPAPATAPASPPSPPPRRVTAAEADDEAVMAALHLLGIDPLNLLPYRNGSHEGIPERNAVRDHLGMSPYKVNTAWRRLKAAGRIRYAKPR